MGWHYILKFKCRVLPEYIDFIEMDLLSAFDGKFFSSESELEDYEEDYNEPCELLETYRSLPKPYRNLINLWELIGIHSYCGSHTLEGDELTYEISKKVSTHNGDLHADFIKFMKDILVPITSEISQCSIESDDYDYRTWYYTDSQLRNIHFNLNEKVKAVYHKYSADGSEITETRVVYKHPIKRIQYGDLDRAYS